MLLIGYGACIEGWILLFGFLLHVLQHEHRDWLEVVIAVCLLLIGSKLRPAGARISQNALTALSPMQDTQIIGHIINMMLGNTGDRGTWRMARKNLLHLLPRMEQEDLSRLSALQQRFLYQHVKYGNPNRDGDLLIAILTAFERVGNIRAIPAVRKLLRREVKSDKARRVHEKAQQCLATLIERSKQAQADTTLMRASDSPEPSTEGLLRPAASTQEDAPQQLLRPHKDENEEGSL